MFWAGIWRDIFDGQRPGFIAYAFAGRVADRGEIVDGLYRVDSAAPPERLVSDCDLRLRVARSVSCVAFCEVAYGLVVVFRAGFHACFKTDAFEARGVRVGFAVGGALAGDEEGV